MNFERHEEGKSHPVVAAARVLPGITPPRVAPLASLPPEIRGSLSRQAIMAGSERPPFWSTGCPSL
jgi:hypothetical protein